MTDAWKLSPNMVSEDKSSSRDTYFKCCPANTNASSASHAL